ncbi:MAG: hypothetical protein KDC38_18805, partial [Planctomycetes bacterium]|nr:hypothetical protein [Planctomycetota bacterium]
RRELVAEFVATGKCDDWFRDWPGQNLIECAENGGRAFRDGLIAEVRRRESRVTLPAPAGLEEARSSESLRRKLEPMVRGLFPPKERETVLDCAAGSVRFLAPDSVEEWIRSANYLSTAWKIAWMYLGHIGAPLIESDVPPTGYSEDSTCYVSLDYFDKTRPLDDLVVHEVAHLFHNTRRESLGLPTSRGRKYLLSIEYFMRETFAYACEFYSQILLMTRRAADRRVLVESIESVPDDRVDAEELRNLLLEAIDARNGWKVIRDSCTE